MTFLFIVFLSFYISARRKSNLFESNTTDHIIQINKISKNELIDMVHTALREQINWCDAFLDQNSKKLKGTFTYKKKLHIAGIGYAYTATKGRSMANKNCLAAIAEAKISSVGAYSTTIRITTANGVYLYVIMRTPPERGFRSADFNDNSESLIDDLIPQ